ncbi:MAG: NAD-dependent epimerase/dehydratase family protein [Acidimicrobiales bacterium]|nr:NAD-dependent epimerase/dehydratase family protein [Acidimicrobiales bacterium]
MTRVVVTGAAGAIGSRVVRQLARTDGIDVLAVDRVGTPVAPDIESKRVDLAAGPLASIFAGADVIVHLASAATPGLPDPTAEELDLAIAQRVLDGAAEAAVGQVVILSTAMVYGAWAANPVPLTEDAPVRPNPDLSWAVARAEVERLALEWGSARPDAAVAVLRPTAIVTDDALGGLARVLHSARVGVAADGDPPVQYLHLDDLAAAVVAAVTGRLDGVANVAPDGWIPPDNLSDLEGPKPRLRVPSWVARALAAARWRFGVAPIPPGVVPYTSHSWVVNNDRMRELGWSPSYSNEEAWVVSHEPGPLDRMPARRRQELALVASVLAIVGVVVGAVLIVRRLRRSGRVVED